ncbi:ester hydrolase C11orf54 homolog [Cataglyphis hispanica]|uniref:ester hydrolase C11orf54 homolog n=1 Tax=Cataglyphis hispanica TaxID=1086592 RepID=UPI0021808753|nr:ester hydrolase C11orf54 homolog [Cataglyphis hispanica]
MDPHHVREENNRLENEDIRQNDNANAAPNGNAVRENNDARNENAAPNGNAVRENNDARNGNAAPNRARNIRRVEEVNFDLENVNFIPNDVAFAFLARRRRVLNIQGLAEHRLFRTTLEHIKNVFLVGLTPHFDEFDVQVVSCPPLTRSPYNLAKNGLSGSPIFLRVGTLDNIRPNPSVDEIYDIRDELLECIFDSFIIGAGFAAKPSMPYNGVLTMNATAVLPDNVNNNSRIAYEDNVGLLQQQKVEDPRHMVCAMMGNFFINEGRSGLVIRVRIKGHKRNILGEIQRCLLRYCKFSVVLGGVFLINGGRVICSITKETYPQTRYWTMHRTYAYDCKDLVALGVVANTPFEIYSGQETYDTIYTNSRFKFHVFSDGEPAGIYQDDLTPKETEYVGYFNIAERAIF